MNIIRRTFEATKFPPGSDERARLNLDAATSEYMPSYRYLVNVPFNPPTQPYFQQTFTTHAQAREFIANQEGRP